MSQSTTHLSLPYIQGGQAQKHVTHNEALRALDTVVQLSVLARSDTPDPAAEEGDRYVVAPGGTAEFAGHDGEIALRQGGAWQFTAAQPGWMAWDQGATVQIVFDGTDWLTVTNAGLSGAPQSDTLGINTSADMTNRLAVASDAVLFTHDTGGSQQVKVNKAAAADTASLLFQSGYSGRAEMGLARNDNFEIKVSADGSSFATALQVDGASGAVSLPNSSAIVSQDALISRAGGMVSNSGGYLGAGANYPASLIFDPGQAPNLPAAFSHAGHYGGAAEMSEFLALDPNRAYRVGAYVRQESVAGDWSGFTHADRHAHSIGFRCYDVDGNAITVAHHARYHHAGTDSLTTLTQPLAPGDTVIHVADASGWNETSTNSQRRGIVIFGYKNSHGAGYEFYSRIEDAGLFDLGGVNKTSNLITLNQPLPAALGNPEDGGGVWPVGTRLANSESGFNYKMGICSEFVPAAADTWYRVDNAMGGIDTSGQNVPHNFPPGTVTVRPVFLMNYTNRVGGYAGHPDTGAAQRAWVTGLSVTPDPAAVLDPNPNGSRDVHVIEGDASTGAVSLLPAALKVTQV